MKTTLRIIAFTFASLILFCAICFSQTTSMCTATTYNPIRLLCDSNKNVSPISISGVPLPSLNTGSLYYDSSSKKWSFITAIIAPATGYTQINSGTKVPLVPSIPGAGAELVTGPASSTSGDCVKYTDNIGTTGDTGGSCLFTNNTTSIITSNITMTTAGTFYIGPSTGGLSAGTWLLNSTISFQTSSTTSAVNFVCKLFDGTSIFASSQVTSGAVAVNATRNVSMSLTGIAVESSAVPTFAVSCTSDTASQTMLYQTSYVTYNNASTITAIRIK